MPKTKRIKLSRSQFKRLAQEVYKRDNWTCQWKPCGRHNNLSPHHIIFRSQGGSDVLENLVTLCLKCHSKLHSGHIPRDLMDR